MKSTTILAVIVIAVIVLIVLMQWMWARRYGGSRFGYFINQQQLGAIFPQTGEPLILSKLADRIVVMRFDEKTRRLVARSFPEFDGGFIVIPDMNRPSGDTTSDLPLYVCAAPDEVINPKATKRLSAVVDNDTKMPMVKVGDAANAAATWKFHPIILSYHERAHQLMGLTSAGRRDLFAEMPQQFPMWVSKNAAFTAAMQNGTFRGYLKNTKFAGFQYPANPVELKRWGNVGIMLVQKGQNPGEDPQILLVPTPTNMVFRAFSMQTAQPGKASGRLENYTQLVATSGVNYELSKTIIDTDAARWTLVLTQ